MVGGGPGAFIGAVHRIAARMDDHYELVAAALSSDPARSRAAAQDLHIAPDRAYGSYTDMARAEAARQDRIEAVAIVTPNNLHYPMAKAFLEAGIHVICDKPLTTTVQEAVDLAAIVRSTGLIFGLTHNYTGYPMVRQARQMIAEGQLGKLRVVQVEYAQDWLATPLENTGQKQAAWRTDPAQSGPGGSLGDIGTHAYNIACFVTGLRCREVAADVSILVPGRRLDDNVQILLRFAEGAKGGLWASQVATGNANNLRLRVYGEKAGLEWHQEEPNTLQFVRLGEAPETLRRPGPEETRRPHTPAAFPPATLKAIWKASRSSTRIWPSKFAREANTAVPRPRQCSSPPSKTASMACASSPPPSNPPSAIRPGLRSPPDADAGASVTLLQRHEPRGTSGTLASTTGPLIIF